MTLTNFSVVHEQDEHDITLIHCFAGRELVLAKVPRETLILHFGWPKTGRDEIVPSFPERNLVVDRNLGTIEPIIQAKHDRGDFEMHNRFRSTLKLITLTHADLQQSGVQLTDTVIDMARAARFVRA